MTGIVELMNGQGDILNGFDTDGHMGNFIIHLYVKYKVNQHYCIKHNYYTLQGSFSKLSRLWVQASLKRKVTHVGNSSNLVQDNLDGVDFDTLGVLFVRTTEMATLTLTCTNFCRN